MSPAPIRSVLMSGGQGDVVMAALGLLALQRLESRALHPDMGVHTRSVATPVAAALLPDMRVTSMEDAGRPVRPRYYTSADTSWSTVIRNWFYPDWYVNFPEYRRWASFGQPSPGLMRRAQTHLCTLKLGPGMRWKQDTPAYYGLKMWAPLATAWGHTRIDLERALYASFPLARERLAAWAAGQNMASDVPPLAVFPGAGAYQYLPPELIADCLERAGLAADDLCCWFAPGDALFDRYQQVGLPVARTASVGEIGAVIHQARCVVAPDSFVSHLAQVAARGHVAAMSHDLPVHTVHPAAPGRIVFETMDCCPCHYFNRPGHEGCAAGHPHCNVYDRPAYRDALAAAIRTTLDTVA